MTLLQLKYVVEVAKTGNIIRSGKKAVPFAAEPYQCYTRIGKRNADNDILQDKSGRDRHK